MRKSIMFGTCSWCPKEIFSWREFGEDNRQFVATTDYRDVAFVAVSPNPTYMGTIIRLPFCSDCYKNLCSDWIPTLTLNHIDGEVEATERSSMDDENKRKWQEEIRKRTLVGFANGEKTARQVCQHCYAIYAEGGTHYLDCKVLNAKKESQPA